MLPGKENFISVYQDVDIALDTFPYNGTTTTCESLSMGVPVIALRGDRFVSRVGASLLTYTGLQDLIAESPQQYIDLAVQLARDPQHLADLRQQLRPHLLKTPVFDPKYFTNALEQLYREVFQEWSNHKSASSSSDLKNCAKNLSVPKNLQESSEVPTEVPI